MSKNTGGSAFPTNTTNDNVNGQACLCDPGMTLRDYFAAKAMQGMIGTPTHKYSSTDKCLSDLAKASYMIADAMLAERAK